MSGLSPGPWHRLGTVVVLVCWVGSLAADQVKISALTIEKQTNISVTLKWEPADGNSHFNVSWAKDGLISGTANTLNTQYTVVNLEPGTMYEFTVKAEENSSEKSINASTLPNEVGNLRMDSRSNSSVSLKWVVPSGPPDYNYTYWLSWASEGILHDQVSTEETEYRVDNLEAATVYNFTVWTEKNGVNSSGQSIQEATVPNEVGNLRMDSRSNSSVSLKWVVPSGPPDYNYIYWLSWASEGILHDQVSTEETEYRVDNLEAATVYNFTVWTEKNGVNSSGQSIQEATVPNEVRDLRMDSRSNSSVSLKWVVPSGPPDYNYTYWLSWASEGILHDQVSTEETEYRVDNLEAATVYNFTVWTEKNGVNSSGQSIQEATVPNEVRDLRMDSRSNSSVSLKWVVPSGPPDYNYTYWLSWASEGILHDQVSTEETEYRVDNLEAATVYNFTVWTEKNGVNSSGQSIQEATVPNEVRDLRMDSRSNSSVNLTWTVPSGPQASSYTYRVSWSPETELSEANDIKTEWYTAKSLEPGTPYEFKVYAISNGVSSPDHKLRVFTVPNEVKNLKVVNQTNTSIEFSWIASEVPTSFIYNLSSSLSETPEQWVLTNSTNFIAEGLIPGTWYQFLVKSIVDDAQSPETAINASTAPDPVTIISCTSADRGYKVALNLFCPPGNQESLRYEVGNHQGTWPGPCVSPKVVDGLQPARSYRITLQTFWAGMSAPSAPVTCHTESGGVIAGAIIGVLLFILLVGVLVFFLRRQQSHRKVVKETSWVPDIFSQQASSLLSNSLEYIPVEHLEHYVKEKQKDSNYGFAEEYQQLTLEGTEQLQTAALALENKSKNRFSNVLPYDWSRVSLQPIPGDPGSDYINASFIPGLCGPREYIATQGPLPQTVSDFWRLVWDQQSRTIVMLTNCMESGRVKCEHYWPLDSKPCTYGRLRVTLKGENVAEYWTIRNLQVYHTDLKESLPVLQFHYTLWPDHGVPRSPEPLLAFQAQLRKWLDQNVEGGPPIIHCSAGVGRTGTLIALDVLLRQLQEYRRVGVQSFVKEMRRSRPLMVQTEGQYIFLYQTLLRFLQQSKDSENSERDQDVLYENVEAIRAYDQKIGVS